jgi:hypothetical protein
LRAPTPAARARRGASGGQVWAKLEAEPPADRMLAVCMYCERIRADTGEWIAPPPELAEMLRDRRVVQLTHGACPICLAGHQARRQPPVLFISGLGSRQLRGSVPAAILRDAHQR